MAAGAIPIVLGGDHSITEPDVKAVAAIHGPVALVHFDTHTDTGDEVFGVEVIPTARASTDITSLVAERIVRETLTGIAVRHSRAGK